MTGKGGDLRLYFLQLAVRGLVLEGRVKFPVLCHEINDLGGGTASQRGGHVPEQPLAGVVCQPVGKVVETGGIAGDDPVAIPEGPEQGGEVGGERCGGVDGRQRSGMCPFGSF